MRIGRGTGRGKSFARQVAPLVEMKKELVEDMLTSARSDKGFLHSLIMDRVNSYSASELKEAWLDAGLGLPDEDPIPNPEER